ncbi:multicopper oxidase domain-containing protein [Dankookia sp. P2]|uniref:multicopper oxidase domain-containing protein n=1 Tax=Dankookia sp. P2 TaxID=3423955 RepID=UPI003D678B83
MRFQVVSMDGTTVGLAPGLPADRLGSLFGGKFKPEPCGDAGRDQPLLRGAEPVCADSIRLMPSARIEIFVTWRDAAGRPVDPPPGATALLRNASAPDTGGDAWPNVVLASIGFRGPHFPHPAIAMKGPAGGATAAYLAQPAEVMLPQQQVAVPADLATAALAGALPAGDARLAQPGAAATALRQLRPGAPGIEGLTLQAGLPCRPLPAHWRRRILFGVPAADPNAFGLGYELVDDGNVVRERQEIAVFQHDRTTVCVPLKGAVPATETWELVNLAGEDHNFHIHQTRFQVLPDAAAMPVPPGAPGAVFQDNVPVPRASGGSCDGTLDPATHAPPAGCTTRPVFVSIAFQELGDFVYHCHILEHEDGGMMARIAVRAVP